jgi:hypothetical protein
MITALLSRFAIVLIPLGFYVLWMFIISRRVGGRKRVAEHIRKGLLFWAIVLTIMLMIGSFIWWGVSQQENSAAHYVPAHTKDGQLIPSTVK